jgi:type I restriction-modification system DNA methylase subunit
MDQSSLGLDPLAEGYQAVYDALTGLRESFHRSGRLDDSNAKLDEVAKLFATYLAYKRGLIKYFPRRNSEHLVEQLQKAFAAASELPQYAWDNGRSIFGTSPSLILRAEDDSLARDLVDLVCQCVDLAFDLRDHGKPFDILNEAFGHFVRDNFRGNVEDAQYMTPPEVVDFIVDIVIHDLKQERQSNRLSSKVFRVLDPSCGVGSFLTTFYHRARFDRFIPTETLHLLGQDKVERMARLATINLELFDVAERRITVGNSLEKGSALDSLNGSVDLILTNPPFGARFIGSSIKDRCGDNTPFFSGLKNSPPSVDSELLFIDRNMRLLRDGGRLLIVVPDGVVSAKGAAAIVRQNIAGNASLNAVIELPPVTFAQAGTRTKTSILYVQKGNSFQRSKIFMSLVSDLGFQVSSRKGVQIKQAEGENQLAYVLSTYKNNAAEKFVESNNAEVLSREPSCVAVPQKEVLRGSWTPNHYSAKRFDAIASIAKKSDVSMVRLSDIAELCADSRRNEKWSEGTAFLSVLHVLGEGMLDLSAMYAYSPKTPGIPAFAGEILLSRINPRIPRVCITPDLGVRTLCSSEFEIIKARQYFDPYALAYLLLTATVQSQIRSLTSGTSASHNRIRSSELASVLIPVPNEGTEKAKALSTLAKEYKESLKALSAAAVRIAKLRNIEHSFFS